MYQYWPEPSSGLIPIPKLDAVPAAPIFGNFSGNTYQNYPNFSLDPHFPQNICHAAPIRSQNLAICILADFFIYHCVSNFTHWVPKILKIQRHGENAIHSSH